MRKYTIYLLLTLIIASTILIVFAWIENIKNIEITFTKNQLYYNELKLKIRNNNNIDSLRNTAITLIDGQTESRKEKNDIAWNVFTLISWSGGLILISLILIIIEFFKIKKSKSK